MADQGVDFKNFEELAQILKTLGLRLHYLNRVGLGESGYYWHYAEVLRELGRMADLQNTDPAVKRNFGDGYTKGEIPRGERHEAFLNLLRDRAH